MRISPGSELSRFKLDARSHLLEDFSFLTNFVNKHQQHALACYFENTTLFFGERINSSDEMEVYHINLVTLPSPPRKHQ